MPLDQVDVKAMMNVKGIELVTNLTLGALVKVDAEKP